MSTYFKEPTTPFSEIFLEITWFSVGDGEREIELGRCGPEGLGKGDSRLQEGKEEDLGGWEGEGWHTSMFFALGILQIPSKMSPLPLIIEIEGKSMSEEPQGSDPTHPVKPSLSFSRNTKVSSLEKLQFLDNRHRKRGFSLIPRSIWDPVPKSTSRLRTSLDDDEPRRRRGLLLLRCPCRRSTLGGKRVDHIFFETIVSSSCVESLIWTTGAFPFLAAFSSLQDQTSIPEGFIPPKFWPNPDEPFNLQPTVVSEGGVVLERDWAFNSKARPSSPKISSMPALSSPGQSSAIAFADEPTRWRDGDDASTVWWAWRASGPTWSPLWHHLFSLFAVAWVLPFLVREVFSSWHGSFVDRKRKKVWQTALLYLFGTIWKESNNRMFDNKEYFDQGLNLIFFVIFGCGPNCL